MEMHGSLPNELYSNILQTSSVQIDRRSTTIQKNDNFYESDPGDSWYDDDSCEKLSKASDMDREWRRRHYQFHTLGYREGLIAGNETALQEGFNIGFKDFVLAGYNWGVVRGISSVMASLPGGLKEKLVETEETRNKFHELHESVQCISSAEALKLFYQDQERKSLNQNDETDQYNLGVLENYHVRLQSILDDSKIN